MALLVLRQAHRGRCAVSPRGAAAALAALSVLFAFAVIDDLRGARAHVPPAALRAPGAGRIDLNREPWWRIALLPGIGPARARRIVAHRERVGPFRALDDLLDVEGIPRDLPARIAGRAVARPGAAGR
ncbi:MAG: helix-hairpin-helix domain-containing protein [Planctomycetes bacterium]|nr:helix-hairpin-helix domain-containing protein [Planctomycetota bacterium]